MLDDIWLNFRMRSGANVLPLVEKRARVHPLFATPPGIAAAV